MPELRHVIDDDQIGVEVDYAANTGRQEIRQVDPRVVERLIQRSPNGVGDLSDHQVGIEVVEVEAQVRERRRHDAAETIVGTAAAVVPVRGDEVENDVLRARSVLEDGENTGDRASQVGLVERHRDVDHRRVVERGP